MHLHRDDFWGYIKRGHIDPWLPEATGQNRMIMEIAAAMAAHYARNGYFVALDGVIGPWSLPPYRALDVPVHYLVLRTPVEEAVRRCQRRGGDSLTDPRVVADLHAQFADLGVLERPIRRDVALGLGALFILLPEPGPKRQHKKGRRFHRPLQVCYQICFA